MLRFRFIIVMAILAVLCSAACAQQPSRVSVMDYGAKGDGVTDDTAAFEKALAAVKEKGGVVFVPVGTYMIKTHLDIPMCVCLEGEWQIPSTWREWKGSTLLAVEGEGSEEGTPFISLHTNSAIKGLAVFYPNQSSDSIKKYPWCVASAGGDNTSIVDCLLVNPYNGVDFGTQAAGRHYIRGLYGQPLRRGLFIDQCYDIGRVENVHFWPFWKWGGEKGAVGSFMAKYGEALIFARTDWEYVFNTFVFGYGVGYRFIKSDHGVMNGNLVGIGADAANIAVLVEDSAVFGLLITNGEFVSMLGDKPTQVVVKSTHSGVVQFSNCAFWGGGKIGNIEGTGSVSFNNCNFQGWDQKRVGEPAIETFGGRLLVNGCTFQDKQPQIALRGKTQSAAIVGNIFGGLKAITNPAGADLQMGMNVFAKGAVRPKEESGAIVVDDADKGGITYTGKWILAENSMGLQVGYYLGTRWAVKGKGEAKAVFAPKVPKAGRYAVYAYFGPDHAKDHATDEPITIAYAGGEKTVRVDVHANQDRWVKLGTFRFAAGRKGAITFSNDAKGNVLADAVKLVPAK